MYDFFNHYLYDYIDIEHNTEAPVNCHRWSAISILGAWLGQQYYFPFGHAPLMPNQYIQIIGQPATRKTTAIKQAKKLLNLAGYTTFAPEKISIERYLMDLHEETWGIDNEDTESNESTLLEENLFGSTNPREQASNMPAAESFIASDEFVDFIGRNNLDFISLLGTLWDYQGVYSRRLKHSKPVYINNPTISILAGNTPTGFNEAFPPNIQGQGFFSRLLLIQASPTGKKIYKPAPPKQEAIDILVSLLGRIKDTCKGAAIVSPEADKLLEEIYNSWTPIKDNRFEHYNGRRYTHLMKLSLICSAARVSNVIEDIDIIMANTLLIVAEVKMPQAMGEFGRSRYSGVSQKILELVYNNYEGTDLKSIIKAVRNDVDSLSNINPIILGLIHTDKIQDIEGKFFPKKQAKVLSDSKLFRPSLLCKEEYLDD